MKLRRGRIEPRLAVRLAGRLAVALVVVAVLGVIGMQFEGIVAKNVALARELSAVRSNIASLRAREASQHATIARLGTARGAVPEIHEKLQLVGPHEELIYLRGGDAPAAPRDPSGTDR